MIFLGLQVRSISPELNRRPSITIVGATMHHRENIDLSFVYNIISYPSHLDCRKKPREFMFHIDGVMSNNFHFSVSNVFHFANILSLA